MQKRAVHGGARRDHAHRAALRRASTGASSRASRLLHEYDENRTGSRTFASTSTIRRRSRACSGTCRATSTTRIPARRCTACCRTASGCAPGRRRDLPVAARARRPTAIRPFLDRFDLETRKSRAAVPQRARPRSSTFLGFADATDTARSSPGTSRPPIRRTRSCGRSAPAVERTAGEAASPRRARGHAHPRSDAGGARDQEAARQVQAQGRHRPVVHALHAARLRGRHAHSGDPLRVSARLRERRDGRPGHRLASSASRGSPTTGCCCSRATRSSTTRRSRSSAIPRRPTTPTSSSSSTTRRRRSTRRSSSASSIATASASPATATAR